MTRVGTKVRRRFADGVYHDGTVQSFDSKNKLYLVRYYNGDVDELTSDEKYLAPHAAKKGMWARVPHTLGEIGVPFRDFLEGDVPGACGTA